MCVWTSPHQIIFQFRWLKGYIYSSCYYHHQIRNINLSHCYHIFPWSCVWDVCYIIFCHVLHMHSGKTGISFSSLLCNLWWVQIVVWPADRIRLFVHYTIPLSSLCKLICRHWTYEMSARYILSSVWVRLRIFSKLSIIQYMGLYVCSLPNWWLIEYIALSYYHHQIGSMNYYPLFRVRSWNNGIRCMSLYILLIHVDGGSYGDGVIRRENHYKM